LKCQFFFIITKNEFVIYFFLESHQMQIAKFFKMPVIPKI